MAKTIFRKNVSEWLWTVWLHCIKANVISSVLPKLPHIHRWHYPVQLFSPTSLDSMWQLNWPLCVKLIKCHLERQIRKFQLSLICKLSAILNQHATQNGRMWCVTLQITIFDIIIRYQHLLFITIQLWVGQAPIEIDIRYQFLSVSFFSFRHGPIQKPKGHVK